MKKILLSLASVLIFGASYAQTLALPLDFESTTVTYSFTDFDGGGATVISNPQSNGINTSANVGQMIKSAGQVWGGSWIQTTNPIDFSVNKKFQMKVYSPRVGARVLLKVENGSNGGIFFEKEDTSTVANAWELLEFDFGAINTSNTYSKVVLIWDLGVMGDGSANFTFLFDDIELVLGSTNPPPTKAPIDLPITWNDTANVDYTVIDFGGNASSLVPDPTNASNLVLKSDKTAGAQVWAGTTFGNSLGTAIPFASGATIVKAVVYSPTSGTPVRMKVEDQTNPGISVETEVMTTVANAWDTLTFDFSNHVSGTAAINFANTYDKMSIFYNFGSSPATAETYYVDHVQFGSGGTTPPAKAPIDLPITWDDTTNVDYTVIDFGGNASSLVPDPTNASNLVLKSDKTAGAQVWAGTSLGNSLGTAIPFVSGATIVKAVVYSPTSGTPVRMKVEDQTNPGISVETEVMTTVANAWDTLTFDFSNHVSGTAAINFANTYDKMSIFYNFGTSPATAETYYVDHVQFGSGGTTPPAKAPIDLPITWDDTTNVDYTVIDFGGNASSLVPDPTNASNLVLKSDKSAGAQVWAGTTFGNSLGTAIPFASGATIVKAVVYSPTSGTPVRMKVEDQTNPGISVETEVMTTVANAWDTLTFDFSNHVSGTAAINFANTYDKMSIFYNFGTSPATAETYYVDHVQFGSGGTTPPAKAPIDLPITWNDTVNVDYTVIDFGGNASSLVADPTNASNLVLKSDKTAGAQVWAGTSLGNSLATALPFNAGNTIVKAVVYSPTSGTPVRMKVEDQTNPGISVETEAMTTVANAWDTLTFDFSNHVSGTAAINFANTYDKMSIFYNFGTSPASAETYYLDDVVFGDFSTSIIDKTFSENLKIYPNPSTGIINFKADNLNQVNAIEVYNTVGKLVYDNKSIQTNIIDLSELDNGLYFVKMITDNSQKVAKVYISK